MRDKTSMQGSAGGQARTLLKEAVGVELTNHDLYWGRAIYWDDRGFARLAAKYREEADEEREHARRVADRLAFLGEQADLNPEEVYAVSKDDPPTALLGQELAVECEVADQYSEWCGEALRVNDHGTYEILSGVLRDTEGHVRWLQQQLRQIELIGEDNWLTEWR